jgi:hypothetical protein
VSLELAAIKLRYSNALGINFLTSTYEPNKNFSLLRRFPPIDGTRKPPINENQPYLNPLDILYDVKKLMDETNVYCLSAWTSTTLT